MLKEEMETHVCFVRDSEYATVDTFDTHVMTKLDKLVLKHPENYKLVKEEHNDYYSRKVYQLPKQLLSFRGSFNHREYTEEQKAQRLEHLKAARDAQRALREKQV